MIKKLTAAMLSLTLAASLGLAAPVARAHGYHCGQKCHAVCAYAGRDGDGVCDNCGRQHAVVCRPKSGGYCGTARRGWRRR